MDLPLKTKPPFLLRAARDPPPILRPFPPLHPRFIIRLFSALRYESMIHNFHPYINHRTTLYLISHSFSDFWNWFNSDSWYPLGCIIDVTLYPGLMTTVVALYRLLGLLHFAVDIRQVCVLIAPFFAYNTTLIAYFLGSKIWDSGACLVAAPSSPFPWV